jgi:hypothetical protein
MRRRLSTAGVIRGVVEVFLPGHGWVPVVSLAIFILSMWGDLVLVLLFAVIVEILRAVIFLLSQW